MNFGSKFENVKGKFEKSKWVNPYVLVNFGSNFEKSKGVSPSIFVNFGSKFSKL